MKFQSDKVIVNYINLHIILFQHFNPETINIPNCKENNRNNKRNLIYKDKKGTQSII